jgi:hypothetical protein
MRMGREIRPEMEVKLRHFMSNYGQHIQNQGRKAI